MEIEAMDAQVVETGAAKLTKEEEEYLDRLLAEKKVHDVTAGLDFTLKLINAGNVAPISIHLVHTINIDRIDKHTRSLSSGCH